MCGYEVSIETQLSGLRSYEVRETNIEVRETKIEVRETNIEVKFWKDTMSHASITLRPERDLYKGLDSQTATSVR